MKLGDEMPVPSLSTESPEQDANVNEYYEYCLSERMKTRGCTISLHMTPGIIGGSCRMPFTNRSLAIHSVSANITKAFDCTSTNIGPMKTVYRL